MKNVLITGFEPFGKEKENPSLEVLSYLKDDDILGVNLDTACLPTTFNCFEDVLNMIGDKQYDIIIHIGQAGGRAKVTLEKVAVNYKNAAIPDNQGNQPLEELIVNGGPDGIFSTLHVEDLVNHLQLLKLPVDISFTAGTYVCNYIMYSSLYYFRGTTTKVGFVHIPFSPRQVVNKNQPSMDPQLVASIIKEMVIGICYNNLKASVNKKLGRTH
ncbi:pyroglutamyl-peptidase I [Proteinivorax hydrogeniformans]|uniref:Pyroglutamyl-peptidase I n=1 Tax=Proteinivorax hydrogeniformans TaxID=1826727 RepID=A0AAU8HR81_9FIRM